MNDKGCVIGIEHIKDLYNFGIDNISKHHKNVLENKSIELILGDGRLGYKKKAPYKCIHVGVSAMEVPKIFIEQLDFGGRLMMPLGSSESQYIYIIDKDLKGNIELTKGLGVNYSPLTSVKNQLNKHNEMDKHKKTRENKEIKESKVKNAIFIDEDKFEQPRKNKENVENEEIKELKEKLNEEKNKNSDLMEKIIKLKKELEEEKSKNKNLEEKIINLEYKLKNEVKNENFEKLKAEISKNNQERESKELYIYETLFEKDKEIKELKKKLSRFPFELKEGEKMISVIFYSCDQKVHHSIICKTSDKFNKIENMLYDSYNEYYDTINVFTVKGRKVNKGKSLDENNIQDNDIIMLNTMD